MPLYVVELDNPTARFLCNFCEQEHERGTFATNQHKVMVFSMTSETAAVGWPPDWTLSPRTQEEIDALPQGYEITEVPY